jgi:hypothetical protein
MRPDNGLNGNQFWGAISPEFRGTGGHLGHAPIWSSVSTRERFGKKPFTNTIDRPGSVEPQQSDRPTADRLVDVAGTRVLPRPGRFRIAQVEESSDDRA